MSEEARAAPAPRRESSDFSIERILARDGPSTSTKSPPGSASFFERSLAHPATLVVRNKLDWLRNFCEQSAQPDRPQADLLLDSTKPVKPNDNTNLEHHNGEELSWLRCTRYCPPKLPRKSCAGKNLKRKPGSHPRIPFTKYQLQVLEDKYKSNAYLSRKDVVSLSDLLRLPQSRIKIWFQNRRARARREAQLLDQTHATRI